MKSVAAIGSVLIAILILGIAGAGYALANVSFSADDPSLAKPAGYEYALLVWPADEKIELIRAHERTVFSPPPQPGPMAGRSELPRPKGYTLKTAKVPTDGLVVLNLLAGEGWEVISESAAGGQPQLLLRRRLR